MNSAVLAAEQTIAAAATGVGRSFRTSIVYGRFNPRTVAPACPKAILMRRWARSRWGHRRPDHHRTRRPSRRDFEGSPQHVNWPAVVDSPTDTAPRGWRALRQWLI